MIEMDYELSAQITNALRAQRRRRKGGFSPSALFAAGEAGFWADVRAENVWQDTARTSPVSAVGQAVASWGLRTATGIVYAEQATAGNRPLFQIDADGRGYLEFDGATNNRWLQTAAVDFSGTDKVTVIAGVLKGSDAARATLVELTAAGVGRFTIEAPSAAYPVYAFSSIGTTLAQATSGASFAAPNTAVLTGLGDISGDSALLRRNGTQIAKSAGDQGTGNYSNAAVYIGRRSGTTLPFSGRIYGLIARGALTTGTQLSAAESWMNAKTGAY